MKKYNVVRGSRGDFNNTYLIAHISVNTQDIKTCDTPKDG